jgi:hypothetical protein
VAFPPARFAEVLSEIAVGEANAMVGRLEIDEGREPVEKRKQALPLFFQYLPDLFVFSLGRLQFLHSKSEAAILVFQCLYLGVFVLHRDHPWRVRKPSPAVCVDPPLVSGRGAGPYPIESSPPDQGDIPVEVAFLANRSRIHENSRTSCPAGGGIEVLDTAGTGSDS